MNDYVENPRPYTKNFLDVLKEFLDVLKEFMKVQWYKYTYRNQLYIYTRAMNNWKLNLKKYNLL